MSDLPWEDSLLERKLQSDLKDLLKTLVAFANSVRPGHIAIILIGEKDDGTVQGVDNADNIQKAVREACDKIYPPISWQSRVYEKEGKPCVRVEIDYDGDTPHFGGPAWIRRGSTTVVASDEVFQHLVELRLSKVRELAKWIDKEVSVFPDLGSPENIQNRHADYHPRWHSYQNTTIIEAVNSFWVTFRVPALKDADKSEPLDKLTLSWDDSQKRLAVLVKV